MRGENQGSGAIGNCPSSKFPVRRADVAQWREVRGAREMDRDDEHGGRRANDERPKASGFKGTRPPPTSPSISPSFYRHRAENADLIKQRADNALRTIRSPEYGDCMEKLAWEANQRVASRATSPTATRRSARSSHRSPIGGEDFMSKLIAAEVADEQWRQNMRG